MPALVSGWTSEDRVEGDNVVLVMRENGGVRFRKVPARWSFFARGLTERDRQTLARDPRVKVVRHDEATGYTRIDCKYRKARRQIVGMLFGFRRAQIEKGGSSSIEILEGDVNPLRRLLSDNPNLTISEEPRLIWIDIEVDSRKSVMDQKEGKARLLSWGFADAEGNSGVEVLEHDTDASERELFVKMFDTLAAYDCVLAWYGDGYDFEVIQERARALKVNLRGKGIPWHRWTWLDHLEVFKKYNLNSDMGGEAKTSFALDHVAGYLLDEGKLDFDAAKTWEAWRDEREKLAAYNLRDCELLPRIEEKTGFIALHLAVCHICRVFPDTSSLNATQQGDGFLLRLGDEFGYRWATKKRYDDNAMPEKFAGAYVMEPSRLGAIDSVHVCDFSGLYPSIIRTFNMSPDTKVDGGVRALYGEHEPDPDELLADQVVRLPTRDTCFRTDEIGMFRRALDTLVAKRAEYQAAMKKETPGTPEHARAKRLQAAFKIVANSFYGILGSPWSRFFDREIAEGVTQVGRWLLENVIEEAKAEGLDPFYGDTDSVFIAGDISTMEKLVAHMNETWRARLAPWGLPDDHPHYIDLDFEKTFSRLILISAKRYAGRFLRYKGKDALVDAFPEVKGLEFKRGDTIQLAREMQVEIVKELLGVGGPLDSPLPTIPTLRAIRERWKKKILEESLDPDAVTLSQSISKPISEYVVKYTKAECGCGYSFKRGTDIRGEPECPQCGEPRKTNSPPMHVRVAKRMVADGHEILVGNRIRYLVIRPERDEKNRKAFPVPVYMPGAFDRIDREYYWKRVAAASDRLLDAVYPAEKWSDTTREKKDRELERRREEFKGVISDLPIFAYHGIDDLKEEEKSSSTEGQRTMRTRKRKRKGPRPINDEDRAEITKRIRETGRVDVALFATERGISEADVYSFAKGVPRTRKRRRRKKIQPKTPAPKDDSPPRRRRRRVTTDGRVVFRIVEKTSAKEGGAEAYRRKAILEKLRDVLEAHPGDHPVAIHIVFPKNILSAGSFRTKVVLPLEHKIATTPEARAALAKLESNLTQVFGWPA